MRDEYSTLEDEGCHMEAKLARELKLPIVCKLNADGEKFRKDCWERVDSDHDRMFCHLMDALAICQEELIKLKYRN